MKIQVLGSGCATCKKLHELTVKAVADLAMKEDVEYVTDVSKTVEMGVMGSPVLAVNGEPVLVGFVPDIERIKEAIISSCCKKGDTGECDCECNCKGSCC